MTLDQIVRLRDASIDAHKAYCAAIAQANAEGLSVRVIAERLGVSHGTIHNIIQRERRAG